MEILTDAQIQIITERAEAEVEIVNTYAINRCTLMVAFRRQLEGDIPTTGGLNQCLNDLSMVKAILFKCCCCCGYPCTQ